MTTPTPSTKAQLLTFLKDPRTFLFLNYALLFLMVVTFGMTGVIALLIATFREDSAADWLKGHYEFQKRTFWLGVGPVILANFLAVFFRTHGINEPMILFALAAIPLLYITGRCITGFNHLLYSRPYPTPKGWMI